MHGIVLCQSNFLGSNNVRQVSDPQLEPKLKKRSVLLKDTKCSASQDGLRHDRASRWKRTELSVTIDQEDNFGMTSNDSFQNSSSWSALQSQIRLTFLCSAHGAKTTKSSGYVNH
mmetsp:Transcript_14997/g.46555  ORF Transcript_14997/g.46555 Transcript_14997/m.46555 type:complete len:115 (+) Transcript_14997:1045-1389(+)